MKSIRDNSNAVESSPDWKQHFPTYSFQDRDIAMAEYQAAARGLESEERIFLNASNTAMIVAAGLSSLVLTTSEVTRRAMLLLGEASLAWAAIVLVFVFSAISVHYFADRRKAVVFASRKVVVLRRMLGLTYGRLQLVLPNWRVEGADNPYAIRMFPGWITEVAFPFWMIGGVSGLVLFVSSPVVLSSPLYRIGFGVAWLMLLAGIFRRALFDMHEDWILLVALRLAHAVRLGIEHDVQSVLYRAKLAAYEAVRLGLQLESLKDMAVFIEDRRFHMHYGISPRDIGRAVLSLFGRGRRSGGSTITQQLARTLFVTELRKTYRRKFVEVFLALWIDRQFSKRYQLDLYLASVRFERNVHGYPAASRHFFERLERFPDRAQAFFLIERLGYVKSGLEIGRVKQLLSDAVRHNLMSEAEARRAIEIYRRAAAQGLVKPTAAQVQGLELDLRAE